MSPSCCICGGLVPESRVDKYLSFCSSGCEDEYCDAADVESDSITGIAKTLRERYQEGAAAERVKVLEEMYEVAEAMRAQGAHEEHWGICTAVNYVNKTPPFGFIGPPNPQLTTSK